MAYEDVPAFIKRLHSMPGMSARALEFVILAACGSGEVRLMEWVEIDWDQSIWTVPGARMKAGRSHRVPLTPRMIAILKDVRAFRLNDDHVFVGPNKRQPFSDMAMSALLKRMDVTDCTVHGFRSSFRDWAGDATDFPREVAEASLAHVVGDATERAYRRGDAFAERTQLMRAWEEHCTSKSK